MSQEQITIESYSEKAIAVFGDTKPIKDHLIAMNGKFNPSLRGNGDEKRAGWIFPKTKLDEVTKLVNNAKSNQLPQITEKKTTTYTKKETPQTDFQITKEMYLALVSRVERLEAELAISKKIIEKLSPIPSDLKASVNTKPTLTFEDDDDDEVSDESEEDVKAPPKRLLSKK